MSPLLNWAGAAAVAVALSAPTALAAQPTPAPVAPPPAAAPVLSPADGAAVLAALAAAPEFAVAPDLSVAAQALASPDPAVHDAAAATLTLAAEGLARAEHGRLQDPEAIDPDWHLRAPYDAAADFNAALAQGRVAAWAAALPRRDPAYLALLQLRARYAAIAAHGGWASLTVTPPLKPGAVDPAVPALRARLAAEGYAAAVPTPPLAPELFDRPLAAALSAFQADRGLKADGVVSADTLQALNAPAAERLAVIDDNLERALWLPDRLPPERIEVDIAAAEATLFEAGQPVLPMRAIVGEPRHRTPSFVSRVDGIVFNPPWIIPTSISTAETWPMQRRHPGYFAREGIYELNGQLIQRAGPKASLGLIKFDMPDPYGVYLHDTPVRSLFSRDKRALSHGCMRLQDPRGLAAALLAPQGWTRVTVDAAIAAGATRRVDVARRIPVYVVYRTALAAPDGRAIFRADVYGWDTELTAAIGPR